MSTTDPARPDWRHFTALAATTLVTLCVELNFTRLASLLFLAADAYWVIAIALLGFGIGGALVAVAGRRLVAHADRWLGLLMPAIGLTALLPLLLFRHVRTEVAGSLYPGDLTSAYFWVFLGIVPTFLLSSMFVSLLFMRYREAIGRLYFFDLMGAGLGCGFFLILLKRFGVERSLVISAALATVAALLLLRRRSMIQLTLWCVALTAVGTAAFLTQGSSPLVPLVGRELRMLYDHQGDKAKLEFQRWDPVARIDITSVEGHSLELPDTARYKLLTQDGGAPSILLDFDKPIEELEFPDRSLMGAAFWARKPGSVLIIGPGGGPDVVVALHYGPREVTAVELNATTIEVVRDHFAEFNGNIFNRPEVRLVHADGRHFVRTSTQRYDVIQLTGVDTTVIGAGGNFSENYLYTLEAYRDYYEHLSDDGVLSLSYPHFLQWGVRSLSMLLKVLHDLDVPQPEKHLVVSASGGYVNFLVKRSPFTSSEVDAITRHFDQPTFGLLPPLYYELWGKNLPSDGFLFYVARDYFDQQAVLYDPFDRRPGPYQAYVERWSDSPDSAAFWKALGKFKPASDDRPFFFTPIQTGTHFGLRLLWILVPALIFIIAPLALFRRRGLKVTGALPLCLYFSCLGVAFITVEMVLLQKFVLFLGHPSLTFAVVLGTLLVSTGAGSLVSRRLTAKPIHGILVGVAGTAACGLLLALFAETATAAVLQGSLALRVALVMAFVVPFGVAMGLLFPNGIRLLRSLSADYVPWAWGINGSSSVIGTVMSLWLAIELGFSQLLLIALFVYLLAALAALFVSRRYGW